jgi:ribosomal protein S18 acetylase RimI-like enzyme
MSVWIVRDAEPADIEAIAGLSREGFEGLYDFDWHANAEALLSACESGKVAVGVAEDGGTVIGYCNLRAWPAGGWIDQLVVTREHRRRGVGRALVDYIVQRAKEMRFWKVSLIVSESDVEALGFYESYGFEQVGRMKDEIKRGTDGILLSFITDYGLHPNR